MIVNKQYLLRYGDKYIVATFRDDAFYDDTDGSLMSEPDEVVELPKRKPTLKEVSYLKEGKEYLVYNEYLCTMFIGRYKNGNFIICLTNETVTRHDEQRYFEVQI